MKLASRQAPRQLFCWRDRCPEERDAKDGLRCFCRMVAVGSRAGQEGVAGDPSPHPQWDPVFHQCHATLLASGSSPQPEIDGKGGGHEEIILVKTPVSSHCRSSLLGTGSDPRLLARVPLSHCQN